MFTTTTKINLPQILIEILTALQDLGTKPILVGGCVRDFFLKLPIKDYDIEIFNSLEIGGGTLVLHKTTCDTKVSLPKSREILEVGLQSHIEETLKKFGKVNLVGKSFGVLKLKVAGLDNLEFDFSFPRTEKKLGNSHQDFEVTTNGNLTFKQAAIRRDFTINAIGYDFFKDEFLDPFGGINDLKNKIIKHIDDKTFCEDSLRVYRAVQFASRFDFYIDTKTQNLCKKIVSNDELQFLSNERIFEELKKLFLKSEKPSIGLALLKEFGVLSKYFGELNTKKFKNSLKNIDNLVEILEYEDIEDFRKLYLFYTILTKDLQKDELISFLEKLTNDKKFIENILLLNKNNGYELSTKVQDIKLLSLEVKVEDIVFINLACENEIEKALKISRIAKDLDILDKPIKPIVQGKDLIKLGLIPSNKFKDILDYALELQIYFKMNKNEIIEEIKKSPFF
jgi:tRNA nucleotidyltransferase (CCA-adding enzyme)